MVVQKFTAMKNKTTENYYIKIQRFLTQSIFKAVENTLSDVPNKYLESFWNIIVAGYSVEFAAKNFVHLYDYVKHHDVDYNEGLKTMYSVYPGLNAGVYVKTLDWYELN